MGAAEERAGGFLAKRDYDFSLSKKKSAVSSSLSCARRALRPALEHRTNLRAQFRLLRFTRALPHPRSRLSFPRLSLVPTGTLRFFTMTQRFAGFRLVFAVVALALWAGDAANAQVERTPTAKNVVRNVKRTPSPDANPVVAPRRVSEGTSLFSPRFRRPPPADADASEKEIGRFSWEKSRVFSFLPPPTGRIATCHAPTGRAATCHALNHAFFLTYSRWSKLGS